MPKAKTQRRVKCPRCDGSGWKVLIVGPHIGEFGPSPGGPSRYECQLCSGSGRCEKMLADRWRSQNG